MNGILIHQFAHLFKNRAHLFQRVCHAASCDRINDYESLLITKIVTELLSTISDNFKTSSLVDYKDEIQILTKHTERV